MSCQKQREQARRAFAARALKRDQRNVKKSMALEAKDLGGYCAEFLAALVAVKVHRPVHDLLTFIFSCRALRTENPPCVKQT
jgi:hypothetical protein